MIRWDHIDLPEELLADKIEALDGDIEAMKTIADYLVYWNPKENPTKEEHKIARKLYKTAIREGDTTAMLNYGGMYREGSGMKHNTVLARYWYLRAVLSYRMHPWEDRSGYRALGNSWHYDYDEDGCPTPTNNHLRLLMAFFWYSRGAKREEMNCLYELGDFYLKGLVIKKNEAKAFALYRKALDAILDGPCPEKDDNYDDVALRLARCYRMGIGTVRNLDKAIEYAEIAAAKYQSVLDKGGTWDKKNLELALAERAEIKQELSPLENSF